VVKNSVPIKIYVEPFFRGGAAVWRFSRAVFAIELSLRSLRSLAEKFFDCPVASARDAAAP